MKVEINRKGSITLGEIRFGDLFMISLDGPIYLKTDKVWNGNIICYVLEKGDEAWFPPETGVHRVSKITVEVEE